MRKPIFVKFKELEKEAFLYDYHIHTSLTDGHSTPKHIIETAIKRKLRGIAFTEHVRKSSTWFNSFINEIKRLRKNYKIKIYYGIESKALDFEGALDATENMLKKSEIIIGSVHRYFDDKGNHLPYDSLTFREAAKIEFKMAMGLLNSRYVDVLGHPGGTFEKRFGIFPKKYLKEIIKSSLKNKKAIEINLKYLKNPEIFINLLKRFNPYVSLGSDAHNSNDLGGIKILMNKINLGELE